MPDLEPRAAERANKSVCVAIVSEERLFGSALSTVLDAADGVSVVGQSKRIDPRLLGEWRPNIVLLDTDGDAAGIQRDLAGVPTLVPEIRVVAITKRASTESLRRWSATPIHGYFVKDSTPAQLVAALRTVASGATYVDPHLAGSALLGRSRKQDPCDLSPREQEVLRLVADGLENREIGSRLQLSHKTIKNHVSNIFAKLNLTTRTQAAAHAFRSGLAV